MPYLRFDERLVVGLDTVLLGMAHVLSQVVLKTVNLREL